MAVEFSNRSSKNKLSKSLLYAMACSLEHVKSRIGQIHILKPNDNIGMGGREDEPVKKVISEK